ncbi:MAG: acyl-CoA dehydrogenase family protein, partial [Actinobacteria bacterium]|nr:acyl-CoA dehydrogenase family protein [Actinomycetota bacterium]
MTHHDHDLDPFAETEDQQALRALARDVADRALAP